MTLGGRIGLALFTFGLVTLIAVGGALWVSLRDLHRDAALASLAELTLPYVAQARQSFPLDILRPRGPGESRFANGRRNPQLLERFRASQAGRVEDEAFVRFVAEAQEEIDAAGISVLLVQDGSAVVRDTATGEVTRLEEGPEVRVSDVRGVVETGTTTMAGLGDVLYAATPVRDARSDRAVPALVLVRPDDSAELASADLARALAIAAAVLLLVGIPLALGLSRSVTGPLRRLAAASDRVARGEVPELLPTSGPTEVGHAAAAFNAMVGEVSATREAQRRFLADARHDLRTPLTVISGFAEALRDGTASGPDAGRAADAIADEAARLERMLADLDQLSVSSEPGQQLHPERIDGRDLIASAAERFDAQARANGQALDVMPAVGACEVIADRDALDRILGNIVANAMLHAPAPGGTVRLEIAAIEAGDAAGGGRPAWSGAAGVVLAVHDDGPGVPAEDLPHIFDRFYRADMSRSTPGSGLGLAIVRDLATALGGRAFAENLPAGGARVGIVLPAAPRHAAPGTA